MIRLIDERIARALARVRMAFRGVLTALNTAPAVQLAQADGLSGEQIQAAELMQHYGLTSAPPAGTMVVALPLGGRTAHTIIIATEHDSYRLKGLQSGEVALYTDEGDKIVLKRGRVIEIDTQHLVVNAGADVVINTPQFTVNASGFAILATPLAKVSGGELRVDEDLTDRAAHPDVHTARGMRTVYNGHTHHENDVHGETNVPTEQM